MDLSINLTNDPEATLLSEKTLNAEQRTKLDTEIRELYKRIRELESTQTELKKINYDLDTKLFDVRRQKKEEARQAELREIEKQQARAIEDTVAEIRRLTSDFPTIDKLHEYQLEDVVSTIQAYRAGKRGMLNANDMGMGKLNPLYSKILTPNGWTTMGDLQVGTVITGKNGLPQRVEAIYPQGIKSIYRVTMSDGTYSDCGLEHLWEVRNSNDKRRGTKRILTTEQIMNDLTITLGGGKYNKWFIPTVEPVEYTKQDDLPIHPYALGALLGDGSFRHNNVTFTCHTPDKFIVDTMLDVISDDINYYDDDKSYGFIGTNTREKLKKLGLWGHKSESKFIPEIYKTASIQDRIYLIQGLMDTDGSIDINKHIEYSSSSKQLAYDVAEVIRSLGGVVSIKTKTPTYTHKGAKLEGLLHYRLSIKWGLQEDKPFRLERKINRMTDSQYNCDRSIASIEYYGDFEAQCIRVSNLDHLYVTDDFIVTHNTVETVVILYVLTKLMELSIGRKPSVLWLTKKSLMQKSSPKEVKRWNPECSVVTPATAKNLQDREFYLEMYEYTGADIFMANYEFVRTTPKCLDIKWDIVVIDEVHKLKGGANASGPTKIWETIKNLCIKSRFVLMLSGTPMVNAPEEMWSYLHIFNPEKFPDIKRFRKDFMDYKKAADGILSGVLEVKPDLIMKHALKGQMIRRSAEEVGLQLPELTYEIIELEMTPAQQEAYNMMEKRFFVWLDENEDKPLTAMAIVAQLTRLRQINLWPVINFEIKDENGIGTGNYETLDIRESSKIDEAMDIIENVQQQVVIASTFNEPLFEIERRCKAVGLSAGVIYGGSKLEDGLEEKFQQGHLDVLLLNSAMGEGLNLQKNPKAWPGGASYGILLDRWWSPMRNDQVVKRIYRQGSNIPVFWYELQNVPSVDQFIHAKNDEKNESFASIMTSKEIRPGGEWKSYLKEMFKK